MLPPRSLRRKLLLFSALMGLVAFAPGCLFSPDEEKPKDDTRLTDRDSPQGAITRLSEVWENKLYDDYVDLLHEQFTYWILDTDAAELPWVENDFWSRNDELGLARNMFDAGFQGDESPVESIDWQFTILSQNPTTDADGAAVIEVTTDAVIQVLIGPNDGWRSDTRFVFDVIADPRFPGLYQIKRQREIEK